MSQIAITVDGQPTITVSGEVALPFAEAAAASATAAQAALDDFRGRYYGALSSDPSADPLGNPPDAGDLYFNTSDQTLRIFDGSAWQIYTTATVLPHTHDWTDITGTPTTLGGYGITDGVPVTRMIGAGTGLTGGGDLSADRTLSAVTLPQADWDAGTSTTEAAISPAKLAGAVGALAPFTSMWESATFTGAASTQFTFTHNLGVVPTLLLLIGTFNTATGWFNVGETMIFSMAATNRVSNNTGIALACTASDIKLVFDAALLAINDGTGPAAWNPANLDFVLRAYA